MYEHMHLFMNAWHYIYMNTCHVCMNACHVCYVWMHACDIYIHECYVWMHVYIIYMHACYVCIYVCVFNVCEVQPGGLEVGPLDKPYDPAECTMVGNCRQCANNVRCSCLANFIAIVLLCPTGRCSKGNLAVGRDPEGSIQATIFPYSPHDLIERVVLLSRTAPSFSGNAIKTL